jgi:hypothetical protein
LNEQEVDEGGSRVARVARLGSVSPQPAGSIVESFGMRASRQGGNEENEEKRRGGV